MTHVVMSWVNVLENHATDGIEDDIKALQDKRVSYINHICFYQVAGNLDLYSSTIYDKTRVGTTMC